MSDDPNASERRRVERLRRELPQHREALTGQPFYERIKDPGGADWAELGDEGQSIWRDAEQLVSDRLAGITRQQEATEGPHLPLTDTERNHLRTLFAECNPRGSFDNDGRCRVCAEIDAWRAREPLAAVLPQQGEGMRFRLVAGQDGWTVHTAEVPTPPLEITVTVPRLRAAPENHQGKEAQ